MQAIKQLSKSRISKESVGKETEVGEVRLKDYQYKLTLWLVKNSKTGRAVHGTLNCIGKIVWRFYFKAVSF